MRFVLDCGRPTAPARLAAGVGASLLLTASAASGQVDPINFLKPTQPNVLIMVDTANRMQRDAPTDNTNQTTSRSTSNYYDPILYTKTGAVWEPTLGVAAGNTTASYRRKYMSMTWANGGGDKFDATSVRVTGDREVGYALFEAPTRMNIARAALYQAVAENQHVARFGLLRMRGAATPAALNNAGPVHVTDLGQQTPTDSASVSGRWKVAHSSVAVNNGSAAANTSELIRADSATANADLLTVLSRNVTLADGGTDSTHTLIPAGNDAVATFDAPLQYMVDDLKTEALRLANADISQLQCRNTVAVLITGGGEGTTVAGANPAGAATAFLTALSGRRIPIIVIALAPPASDIAQLKAIATNSGGQYFEITKAQIDAALVSPIQANTAGALAGTVTVPEVVDAINVAVQTAFQEFADINTNPFWTGPWTGWKGYVGSPVIRSSEYQVTSPVIGTVNLNQARDIVGNLLSGPQPVDVKDKQGAVIPQRNNVMVTTGFTLPGFDGIMRAFRVYKPEVDTTQQTGYKFKSDGTSLWIAATPSDPNLRNLFTARPDGTMIALTVANVAELAPLMNLTVADATAVITSVRSLPLGAIVDSTPAIMNPPSLDPPPDDAYPGFAADNKNRRTIIWVGTNRGILEGLDARTGLELWGFVPMNLLPKLRTLRDGQSVGNFDYFADGSAKISDVNVPGICDVDHPTECWRTHLIVGEGPGGTFYQSLDVTLKNLSSCVAADDDTQSTLLGCFSSTSAITLNWAFPSYSSFDPTLSAAQHCEPIAGTCDSLPYGDLKATATAIEKTVGQSWSDPAVGQILGVTGPYTILVGSGFLPYATQQQANRGGIVAGTTFYLLDAKTGTVYAASDVGSDNSNETVNNCRANAAAAGPGCKRIKNALQTDPVATGPSDQRYITKAYLGDLDGNVWRFDVSLDASSKPTITAKNKLYAVGADQPIFNSMATVNVGGTSQYVFFGTGSDLLPATDKNTVYRMLAVLDSGAAAGTKSFERLLTKTATLSADERVTAFPAVAGDIVFFTTTTFTTANPCGAPSANLYAFTFIGGAAYDTNDDSKFTSTDSVLIKTIAGERATAPFIVDQHLVFGSGKNVSIFGNKDDFNNGVGQAGVRILSWREVR
jgi:hypothetical protein